MKIQKLAESKVLKSYIGTSYFADVKSTLSFLRGNLVRASRRIEYGQVVDINIDYLFKIGEKQNWKCAITGVPLEFVRGGTYWGGKWCNPRSCTLDRIDNDKGYLPGNVQLVTWEANCMRGNIPMDELVKLCKLVSKHRHK